ncbi:M20 family metallopeptidase [Microbacterium alcoholitolerans]|uniref:M20 family metallopeptidase n=1 Tax=unclassified Microbacterium TaxID=2609290 RepID=UPI003D182C96
METMTDALAATIREKIRSRREEIVGLCAELVAQPSVNPDGDTRGMAAAVSAALAGFGVRSRFEQSVPTMPSVVAELDSGRPGPHLVLNVHMDTMPPGDESAWSVPIYELTRKDGRLYGLGMGNMKGSVAAMIHAVRLLTEHPETWSGRVTFTAVSDEVVFGENGAAYLLRTIPRIVGDGMLCGEGPGFQRLAVGEKGVLWLELTATGDAGHSSSVRQGRSATARLAEVVAQVDRLNGMRAEIPSGLIGVVDAQDPGFELTANVGTVRAGTFIGQVAVNGTAEIDLRVPPGMTIDEAQRTITDIADRVGEVTVRRIKGWDPNWTTPESAIGRAWMTAHERNRFEAPRFAVRLPASDASRWRLRGTPALCFGPQPGLSAGVDDYAEEDEVLRCAVLFTTTAMEFLS